VHALVPLPLESAAFHGAHPERTSANFQVLSRALSDENLFNRDAVRCFR
jgi:hypothetical protein